MALVKVLERGTALNQRPGEQVRVSVLQAIEQHQLRRRFL